jgi:integrase
VGRDSKGTAVHRGVRPVGDDRIEVYGQLDGRRWSRTLPIRPTPAGLKRAVAERARIVRELAGSAGPAPATFAALAQRWLDIRRREVALSTFTSYRASLQLWTNHLHADRIDQIRASRLREVDALIPWSSEKQRNNALIPLRGVFDLAIDDDLIEGNSAHRLRQRKHQRPAIDPFSAAERDAIMKELPDRYRPYFVLAFETGARTSELLALTWDRLDLAAGTMRVETARVRGQEKGTKTGSERVVLLTPAALTALRGLPTRFAGGHVFVTERGQPFQKANHINRLGWTPALKRAGVRWRRAYNCRHTRASLGLMAGQSPAFLAGQLGHSIAVLLSRYARWISSDADRAEMEKLA